MPWSLMRRDGDVLVVRDRDNKVVGRHKNRAKALRHLRALYSLEKASFGGDRSAAGRYAAEQRWKGHTKKEPTKSETSSNPYNLQVPEHLANQLSLIEKAMRTVENVGVRTQAYRRGDLNGSDFQSLNEEVNQIMVRDKEADSLNDKRYEQGEISEEEYLRVGELLRRGYEATRLAKMALSEMFYPQEDENFEDELLISRDSEGNLVGLAMVSTAKQDSDREMLYQGGPPVALKVKGKNFYVEYLVSFQTVPNMGRALFGELLRHVKGKNVQSIVLETTDESRDYWERMGFKVQSSYGTVRRYHSLDFPLDLMVEKMEGGS